MFSLSGIGAGGTLITSANYNADADLDRDGDVDSNDLTLIGTSYLSALSTGALSNSTVKNTIGWDGYVFNGEVAVYRCHRCGWNPPSPNEGPQVPTQDP